MKMIDMHFHTKYSDGRKTNEEILEIATSRGFRFAAATDHDVINRELPEMFKNSGIETCQGVEISAIDEKHYHHLHLTCFSKSFSLAVDNILESSRNGRQEKTRAQIILLKSHGFQIEEQEYYDFFENKGMDVDNLNSSHLSNYIYTSEHNKELVEKLTGRMMDRGEFIRECLKDEGEFNYIGAVTIPEYEPNLQKCGEIAMKNKAVLSLAHPNFKLTMQQFKERIGYYLEQGINAVEINSMATKEWVDLILKYQKKYGYILTFGSDCHFAINDDDRHGSFGEMNPYIEESLINIHLYYLQKKIGLIKPFQIDPRAGGDLGFDILEYAQMLKQRSVQLIP